MAKYDPKKRRLAKPHQCGFLKHAILGLVFFVAGYVSASFYDMPELVQWINTHILSAPTPIERKAVSEVEVAKPKFEFYTLLTQEGRTAEVIASSGRDKSSQPALNRPTELQAQAPLSIEMNSSKDITHAIEPAMAQTETADVLKRSEGNRNAYMVQLASFKRIEDAERMKAGLAMKGFTVQVVQVTQQQGHWYRVVLGPYATRVDAERIQMEIARSERISGMIRKIDA